MSLTLTGREPVLDTVTTDEAARELRVTRQTIINWIKSGSLRAGRIGKCYYIPRREIDRRIREVMTDDV